MHSSRQPANKENASCDEQCTKHKRQHKGDLLMGGPSAPDADRMTNQFPEVGGIGEDAVQGFSYPHCRDPRL